MALTVAALALAGCVPPTSSPAVQAALRPAAATPSHAECSGPESCKEQWERAQVWLAKHSKWRVQSATDVMISTYNPVNSNPSYGFSILKEPAGGGRYRILMAMSCGNMFGCSPAPDDVRLAFTHFVLFGEDLLTSGRGYTGIR